MNKVKRFSLEERYGYQNRKVIYDKNDNNDIELNNIYPIIDLLNQLDEQISDLQHRLEVADKALELACDNVTWCPAKQGECDCQKHNKDCSWYFKKKAEKAVKKFIEELNKEHEIILGFQEYEKKIADMEAKLAESEEQLKEELVEKKGLERALSACNRQNDEFADMIKKLVSEKEELKQQLAEKDKEIEYYKKQAKKLNNEAQKYFEDAYCNDFHNQDKISFALEQLEQIRKEFEIKFKGCKWEDKMLVGKFCNITNEIIDNQIKAIKEGK